jgi:hypothetical protein
MGEFNLFKGHTMLGESFFKSQIEVFEQRRLQNPITCPVKGVKKDFSNKRRPKKLLWL